MNIKRQEKKNTKSVPQLPFDEFCAKHGIELHEEPSKSRRSFKRWILAPASFVLVAAIILPIILTTVLGGGGDGEIPTDNPPIIEQPVRYGEDDIDIVIVSQEYFTDKGEILLIDLDNLTGEYSIAKETPTMDSSIDVSYIFKDAMAPFMYNAAPFALQMTYRVKAYEHYTFVEERLYEDLTEEIALGDKEIQYQLYDTLAVTEAYVYFEYNDNEYYLYVKEAMPLWELTEDSLQALLLHLFD